MSERVIVFTRYPEPGRAKTRLIPVLGREGAAQLQREMTEHTLEVAAALARSRAVTIEVRFEGGNARLMTDWLGMGYHLRPQIAGDLGLRMEHAFLDAFASGDERVVVIGTDCPAITPQLLGDAFDALKGSEVVLGPANDGGYYLIGLRAFAACLFTDIPWGTGKVLERTLRAATDWNLSYTLLSSLDDVDRPEDLQAWERVRGKAKSGSSDDRISIVIPAFNEAEAIAGTLQAARRGTNVEIIVIDGGSGDGTAETARACGAKVVQSGRGRARQMNAGAAAATGGLLLFVHADTRLPDGFDRHVRTVLAQPGTAAGAFELQLEGSARGLRLLERAANARSRRLQMPWGDQALFLRAERFRELGGFPEMPIMEDLELVRRLRRRGRIAVAPAAVLTSARRYTELGVFRAWLKNRIAVLAYYFGVSPERIARWYRRPNK